MSGTTVPWAVPGSDLQFDVPDNMSAIEVNSSNHVYKTYLNSSEATADLETNADLKASYMGFSGSASVRAATQTAFAKYGFVALFSYQYRRYSVLFNNAKTFPQLLCQHFLSELQELKRPFDKTDRDSARQYGDFLFRWGTHIITGITYGQRYTFSITDDSAALSKIDDFEACVSAEYSGLCTELSGDASIKSTDSYKSYMSSKVQTGMVIGGDPAKHAALAVHPDDIDDFQQWAGDRPALTGDSPIHIELTSLDDILRFSTDNAVSAYAVDMQAAIDFWCAVRTTLAPTQGLAYSRPALFVKVKDGAQQSSFSLTLSDDPCARMVQRSMEGVNTSFSATPVCLEGFSYGSDGQSLTFQHAALPTEANPKKYLTAGFLTRFNLSYGLSTTVTMVADENVEFVIFASGTGQPVFSAGPGFSINRMLSNHVFWLPDVDSPHPPGSAAQLVLPGVDLGVGALYGNVRDGQNVRDVNPTSELDPLLQFKIWAEAFALDSQWGPYLGNA